MDSVEIASDFGAIVRSHRLAAVMRRNLFEGGFILAAVEHSVLSGYATVVPVSTLSQGAAAELDRWHDLPDAWELGAIEVARGARRRGVATAILARLPDHPAVERSTLLTHGVASHWELQASGLHVHRYRAMLVKLLAHAGFVLEETDDPDVTCDPMQFLAVRVGSRVPAASIECFRDRLLLDPWRRYLKVG